jgi:type VI secretion system protein ImpG
VLKDYYQQELTNLRELGVKFSKDNPALAPMLAAKGDDPDVERLLEGVAFLSALIRQRLQDGFPELIQSLLRFIFPQVLLPTPCSTIMHFRPVQGFTEPIYLKKGAQVASIPVDGVTARFATTEPLIILPAAITKVEVQGGGSTQATVNLQISSAAPLKRWLPDTLTIHFAGDYPEASQRRKLFLVHTVDVEAQVLSQTVSLGPRCLSIGGFDMQNKDPSLRPVQPYTLMNQYFTMPQRFLFLNLTGLKAIADSQETSLTLKFKFANLKEVLPPMRPEHFLLNACPAENVFPHPANPLTVDHKHNEYLLKPQDYETEKLDIFSVSSVSALTATGQPRQYTLFENLSGDLNNQQEGVYYLTRRSSPITGQPEHYLSILYKMSSDIPDKEMLSVELMCHNVGITNFIRTGEITQPTDSSPAMATFTNIIPPTKLSPPVEAENQLWKLLSHLHINLMPFISAKNLKEILFLHAIPNDPDVGRNLSNKKRIEAVESVSARMDDLFIRGLPIRGNSLDLTINQAGFASAGDMYLFGDVLELFFGLFHHINTYSKLYIIEKNSREVLSWPPRLGLKRIL